MDRVAEDEENVDSAPGSAGSRADGCRRAALRSRVMVPSEPALPPEGGTHLSAVIPGPERGQGSPGIHNHPPGVMDSGLALSRQRPGMTSPRDWRQSTVLLPRQLLTIP